MPDLTAARLGKRLVFGVRPRRRLPGACAFARRCLVALVFLPMLAQAEGLSLGIFAYRPKPVIQAQWSPLVNHLNQQLPPHLQLQLQVLDQTELEAALQRGELHYVFTNPVHYIRLRTVSPLSGALATLIRREAGASVSSLGGVIIRRADRTDLNTLDSLAQARIAIAGKQYLGGYVAQAALLQQHGLPPAGLDFVAVGQPHDSIIAAVQTGQADIGFIRTSILEALAQEGKLAAGSLAVIHSQSPPGFPFQVSTPLYPEWPFVALADAPDLASRRIAAGLLALTAEHPAAQAAGIDGFTIPADYQGVADAMTALRLPPFNTAPAFGVADIWGRYPLPVAFGLIALAAILAAAATLTYNNRRLQTLRADTQASHERLQAVIDGTDTGTWEWNVQTGETRFNEHWASMLGYTLNALQPLSIETWRRLTHPDDLQASERELQAHFEGRAEVYDITIRMRHRLGHWVWVHDRGRVFSHTPDGRPLWMFGTHNDVSRQVQAEEIRQAWIQRFEALSANVPGVLYQYRLRADGSSHFPFCSPKILDLYGCTAAEATQDSAPVFAVIHPDDIQRLNDSIQRSAQTLSPWHGEYRVNHPSRGILWVAGDATPTRSAEDDSVVWYGYLQDITETRKNQERQRLAAAVFDSTREGILITDALGRILEINAALLATTGMTPSAVVGKRISSLMPDSQFNTLHTAMRHCQREGDHWRGEIWIRGSKGELLPQLLGLAAVRSEAGQVSNYIAIFNDIRALKAHEQELDRIAHYDTLTGIPNRRLLQQRLDHAITVSLRNHDKLAVCMLDLDGFKPVNDTYGHEAGDQLLQAVAARLRLLLRGDDTVARLGGDEFVLLFRFRGLQNASVFDRLLSTLAEPVRLPVGEVHVTGSLGVAYLNPDAPCDGGQLLRQADHALYQAKAAGRNCYVVFDTPDAP